MNVTTHEFSLCTKQNGISSNYNILLWNWKSNVLRSSTVPHLLSLCHCSLLAKIALGFIQSLRQVEESRQTVKEGLVCVYCPLQKYLMSGFQGSSSSRPGQGNTTLKRDKEKIKSWAVNTYSLAPLFTKLSPTHSPVGQVELHPLEGPCAPYPDVKTLRHALPAGSSAT